MNYMIVSGKKLLIYLMLFIFSVSSLFAETIEEALDNELLNQNITEETHEFSEVPDSQNPWEIYGFIESVNDFYIPDDDAGKASGYKIIKLESHGRVSLKYGTGNYYGKAVMDVFFYPDTELASEWLPPRDSGAIAARELYFKGGGKFQFRIGKQLFSWGTADMFQLTNYLDQKDQRDFFNADNDSRRQGVPALSLKYLIDNFSIEVAGTPVHNPSLMPEEGTYWYYTPEPLSSPMLTIPIVFVDAERIPASIDNGSFAVRAGGNIFDVDFHLSYYNGFNTDLAYKPELVYDISTTSILIELRPYYERVQMFGLDLAFTVDKFSFRAEALYSHDMIAVKEIDPDALQTGIMEIMGTGTTDEEISTVDNVPFCAYVTGADYNLWGNNGMVLVEWMQGMYLKNKDEYIEPTINKMLLVRLQDKFFNESLEAEAGTIMRPIVKDFGYAITAELTWDFKNGLTVSAGGMAFIGKEDELFSNFDDKDMCYLKARMSF